MRHRAAALVMAAGLTLGGILVFSPPRRTKLPVYWDAPEFALVDQRGDTVRRSDFAGVVWVASFVYTHCPDVCPLVTQRMAELRDSLRARGVLGTRIRLVSFSVDPGRDTPDVLQRYSEKFGGSPPSEWVFLTGSPPEQIGHLIEQGFRLAAQRLPPDTAGGTGGYEVMHSPRLLLVDRHGRVRGAYAATEDEGLRQLHTDLDSVLEAED